jgi:hypothetical protein
MTNRPITIAAAVLAITQIATAQEKRIDRSALPPAVEKAVQIETQGATIKGFAQEREHSKTFYEAETVVNGHTRDVLFAADGSITEIEEEVAFNSLPADVQAALTQKAAGAKINKVESLTKKGKLVAYEAAITKGKTNKEIQVGPDGKNLAKEE